MFEYLRSHRNMALLTLVTLYPGLKSRPLNKRNKHLPLQPTCVGITIIFSFSVKLAFQY